MNEMNLMDSPQGSQRPQLSTNHGGRSSLTSRTVVLSLLVFVLSFVVLFAGPALALRLMAGAVGSAGSGEPGGRFVGLYASAAVTDVILQQGKAPLINGTPAGPVYTGTADTYINRWRPTTNFANENRLLVGQSRAYRPLVRFDLTPANIPTNAHVISAQLGLYCYARNLFNEMQIQVYQVIRPWHPMQATWYNATNTDPWTFEGCDHPGSDRAADPATTRNVFERNVFHYFDITPIVQNWVSNPTSNKGVLLVGPDPAVIYYYYASRASDVTQRPKLIITWTIEPEPTPTPTLPPTPGPSPTPTRTPTPSPTPVPQFVLDETSSCYTHTPASGVWQQGTTGGYGGSYEYETTGYLTATARWAPCLANPLPANGMYEVQAHWSVHAARPVTVPYTIQYDGGNATIYVDQTKDANGNTVANFTASGWRSLGYYPFRAGTYTTTGEYVELNTSSPGDTCADAVRWLPRPDIPGPPYTLIMTANPTELPSDGAAISTLVVTVTDQFGRAVADGTMVGFTTTLGTVPYTYTEAESAAVTKLGTWNIYTDTQASGGRGIYSDAFGDQVVWTFWGEAVSLVYATNVGGGVADVTIDGVYATTINFFSPSLQLPVERLLTGTLSSGLHTVRITNGGVGRIWLDAFRAGAKTSGGVVTTTLTAPTVPGTATVRATAIGAGYSRLTSAWPFTQTMVTFPGPSVVWVDDDYCSSCPNGGHLWNYDAFRTIQGGVDKVLSGGTVYVAAGTYMENVTIAKPLSLLGAGSLSTILEGVSDPPGSRGIYVDRADNVTIIGFKIRNFETGVYLRGTGTGLVPRVQNALIVQNKFESNNAGGNSYAIRGSYVYTSTLCSNDISLGYNGIYLDNAYWTTICYNQIYDNLGFGIKLDTGNDNSIDNNEIHDNQNVGIELTGDMQRNGVYGNVLHDLWWDGVLVNATWPSSVQVAANVISRTNLAWRDAANNPPDINHNWGGIVLRGSNDSAVYDNRVFAVSNAQGNRSDAAGIYLDFSSPPLSVDTNLIRGCAGHGIYVSSSAGTPTFRGNSIYSNGRYGLNNQTVAFVDARGNWWGRNVPTFGGSEPQDITLNVSWSPPISLSLTAAPTAIPANGVATSTITATASGFGYNILDGTWITFTSDLNTLVFPASTVFGAGQANTTLRAGTIAGVATITGTAEPGIEGQTTNVTLTALGPHSIAISADPTHVEAGGGPQGRSIVTATVRDMYSNPVPGVLVTFTSNIYGSVAPSIDTTSAAGEATTIFTSGPLLGTAVVTATAGVTLTTATNITVTAGAVCTGSMTIAAVPAGLPANGVATSTITVAMTDCWGNPVSDGTMVGFVTTLGTILNYEYIEAESAAVAKSPGWTAVADGSASGGSRIDTSSPGAAAFWNFRGEAVSLRYRRFGSGGVMHVRVDGGAPVVIDTSGSAAWIERVIATNLNPSVLHQLEVTCQSGTIRLDYFRSGAISHGGRATAILRAPVLAITSTATVYATERIGHPYWPELVVNTTVVFSQTNIVWVDDNWIGLPNGTPVTVPGGTAYIGNNAFPTIPAGVEAVQPLGTVNVLTGTYTLPVNITKTLNLLGSGAASTIVNGGGLPTPGITISTGINNVVIRDFTLASWATGLIIQGASSGLDISNNVFTNCTTLAISGANVNSSRFASNEVRNGGSGFELDTVNNSILDNNRVHDTNGFGIRIFSGVGTSTGNVISYNDVRDLGWNGIIVGANCIDTRVLSNTVRTTNLLNNPTYREGGIVLYNTTNTTVERNTVTDVRTAGGTSADTAGIWIGGTNSGGIIRYNRTVGNANDGILLMNYSSPPEVHCNHIYANGHFGLRNMLTVPPATAVNATGNWWGHNPPLTAGAAGQWDLYSGAGSNVIWDPPIALTLVASQPTVYAGGLPIQITLIGCGGGCCLLDGTPVTFTTNLGGVGDPPASTALRSTSSGQATVMFTPGTVAGTATITAAVPNAGVATTTVTVLPGLPASISLLAVPSTITACTTLGNTSSLYAYVRDMYGNWVADGTPIYFNTSLGSVNPPINNTTGGLAQSTLYGGTVPGIATVTAFWGYVIDTRYVEIRAGPPFTITSLVADPTVLPANGIATSRITATLRDQCNNPVPDGTMVGFTTTSGSFIYTYDEAEGITVTKTGSWATIDNPTASGGKYIQTNNVGNSVSWRFRGQAVSLRYARNPGNGRIEVRIDGSDPRIIDTTGPDVWHEETLYIGLNEAITHTISVFCVDPLPVRLDAFRSGAVTSGGRAVATLTAAPLPPTTAIVWATGVGGTFPVRTVAVQFLAPTEVWVDDNYCSTCYNGGHLWGFDAFSNIPAGVTAVANWGTVHVLAGTYTLPVSILKPLYLDGEGSATTIIDGPGTGNGIYVRYDADGTTIEGFTIRDFNRGLYLDGRSANRIQGITVTNNVIGACAMGAISATYVNNGSFFDNDLHGNSGYGFDLDMGDNNAIAHNYIYNNSGFGLRVYGSSGASTGNTISNNSVHDVSWNGIIVGMNCINTSVLGNTVRATNLANSPAGFNEGGIVLYSSTNTMVERNDISGVLTAGGSLDTAGIWIGGTNTGGIIRYNRILGNANDGVLLSSFFSPPEVHCNHIYSNGRYGLRNNFGTPVHAEGNWWGHNPPPTWGGPLPQDLGGTLAVFWSPAIELALTASPTSIPADGVSSSIITATMRGGSPPCNALDGTPITFTTSLGSLGAPYVVRSLVNGEASVVLRSATIVSTAYVTATTPSAGSASTTVNFVAGPPYTITLSATPPSIWAWGTCTPSGYPVQSTIEVTVTDQFGNPCAGQTVTFTWSSLGTAYVAPTTRVLNANGYHWTVLNSGSIAGTVLVTATAGTVSRSVAVEVMSGPPTSLILDRWPAVIAADGISTATITATVRDSCGIGNLIRDGTMVGFTTSHGTLPYRYIEEGAVDYKSPGWILDSHPSASGGGYLRTDSLSAFVRWQFTGTAVSLIYVRSPLGGSARVFIDSLYRKTINMNAASTEWQIETVIANDLDPSVPHTIQVECLTGRVYLDAIRSGTTTRNGIATAVLTSERAWVTAYITATAVESRFGDLTPSQRPWNETMVQFERANLVISKKADPLSLPAGASVTFTLFYTNTGVAQATNTLISDTLPISLTYVSSVSSPDLGAPTNPIGNVWVWNAGNVLPSGSGVITFTARRVCLPNLGTITNTVSIGSLTVDVPPAGTASAAVTLVPGTPFTITLASVPPSISTDSSSTIHITVTDGCNEPVPGATVYITTNLGGFNASATMTYTTRTTNSSGRATVTLYSGPRCGLAAINASAGAAHAAPLYISIGAGPPAHSMVVASPVVIPADGLSISTISAQILDTGLCVVPDGLLVGFTTSVGSLLYDYAENDSPQVHQSLPGTWNTAYNPAASGGSIMYTSLDGASVYWDFYGNGVSLVYMQEPGAGVADVYVDSIALGEINMNSASTVWQAEEVYTLPGSPADSHRIVVQRRPGSGGPIYVDALRSGVITYGGQASAVLTSANSVMTATVAATGISETLGVPVRLPGFVTVRFAPADLVIIKAVQPQNQVPIGRNVTFTLTCQNLGTITATNAYVDDVLSLDALRNLFFSTQPVTLTEYTHYYWSLGSLAPGQSRTITFGGTIDIGRYWPSATVLTNTASVGSSTFDPTTANNTTLVTTTIVPGLPARLSLVAVPSSITVGGATSTLTATARDASGNLVPNGTVVTFTTTLGGFPATTQYVGSTTSGVATATLASGSSVGTATIVAVVDSITATTQVTFVPGIPFTMTLTANPTVITVGGATSIIETMITDQYGNWVADGTAVGFATTAGTIAPTAVGTVNGRASALLTSGSVAVTATVTATAAPISRTVQVVFRPGTPLVTMVARPTSLKVGETSVVTLTARDAWLNPLSGELVTFTTTLGDFDGYTITTRTTDANGRASVRLRSTAVGQAIVGGTIRTEPPSFVLVTFEPGDPYSIVLSVDPGIIPGCGGTALARAEVRDRYRNLVRDGTVVVFDITPQGDVSPIDGGRTTNGVAQAIISSGTVPGPADVWAWAEQWRSQTAASFGVVFLVGPPDRLELTAQPPSLIVGGNRSSLQLHVMDCGGYPVEDSTPVTFTIVSGQGSLSPQFTTTANGWAYSTLTSPNETGSATIRAQVGNREKTTVVAYIPGPPFTVLLDAVPAAIAADGVSTSTIGAEIKDRYGNYVIDNTTVVFTTDLGRFETGTSFTTRTRGGRASALLTSSTTFGRARVAATCGGMRGEIYVDFYYLPTPTPTPTSPWRKTYLPVIMKHYWR